MKNKRWAVLMLAVLVGLLVSCAGGAPTLDATYNADGLAFNYPADWMVGTRPNATVLANTATALRIATAPSISNAFEKGEVAVSFVPLPADSVAAVDNPSPVSILQSFLPGLDSGSDFPAFGEVTAVTLGTRAAAQASGSGTADDGRAIVVDLGNGTYMLVVAVSPKDEMSTHNDVIDAVLATVTYTQPTADSGS